MKEIATTDGKTVLIDDEDYDLVTQYSWAVFHHRRGSDELGYTVLATIDGRLQAMHRLILGFPDAFVDHINGDRLDNRRSNLRPCTVQQNNCNRRVNHNSRSQLKGVKPSTRGRKWEARIRVHGHLQHLGMFSTPEDAARAYDAAARESFGPFARCNYPEGGSTVVSQMAAPHELPTRRV